MSSHLWQKPSPAWQIAGCTFRVENSWGVSHSSNGSPVYWSVWQRVHSQMLQSPLPRIDFKNIPERFPPACEPNRTSSNFHIRPEESASASGIETSCAILVKIDATALDGHFTIFPLNETINSHWKFKHDTTLTHCNYTPFWNHSPLTHMTNYSHQKHSNCKRCT